VKVNAKDVYNKYEGKVTVAFKDNVYTDKDGNSRINAPRTKERQKYLFKGFKDDGSDNIALIECPIDVLAIEFEEDSTEKNTSFISTKENRDDWIDTSYNNCEKLKLDCSVADHGGTSKYLYLFNIKNLPEKNELDAKKFVLEQIVPKDALPFIDHTNIGKTLVPIIGRPHWKSKYKGSLHAIEKGKHPKEHINDFKPFLKNFKIKEKSDVPTDNVAKKIKNRIKILDLMKEYDYDMTKNPTMCKLGHGSKGGKCFSYNEGAGQDGEDVWNCYHCGEGGDVIDFVKAHNDMTFNQAKNVLLQKVQEKIAKERIKLSYDDYELVEDSIGFIYRKKIPGKNNNVHIKEIATFGKMTKQKTTRINPYIRSEETTIQWEIELKLETNYARDRTEMVHYLTKGKRPSYTEMCRYDELVFCTLLNRLVEVDVQATCIYGFYDGKYHDYPNYVTYNIIHSGSASNMKIEKPLVPPTQEYIDFIKLPINLEKIEKVKDILNNKFSRNEQEKMFHKILLSFAIGACLKTSLYKLGVGIHPYLIVTGSAGLGKTTACKILINNLFNKEELKIAHFQGAKGARLKHINNDAFATLVDELQNLKNWETEFKDAMSAGFLKIVKGKQDGGLDILIKFFTLVIPTNHFHTNDLAFRSRLLYLTYEHANKNTPDSDVLHFLEDNIKYLGKYIYDRLHTYDLKKFLAEIKEAYKDKSAREIDKFSYVFIGEKILNAVGILADIKITTEMISGINTHRETNIVTDVLSIIHKQCCMIYRTKDGVFNPEHYLNNYNITVDEFIDITKGFDSDAYTFFSSFGIYFSYQFKSIIIGKNMLEYISTELQKKGYTKRYTSLKALAEDLGISVGEYKIWNIQKGRSKSIKGMQWGFSVNIFDDNIQNTLRTDDKK